MQPSPQQPPTSSPPRKHRPLPLLLGNSTNQMLPLAYIPAVCGSNNHHNKHRRRGQLTRRVGVVVAAAAGQQPHAAGCLRTHNTTEHDAMPMTQSLPKSSARSRRQQLLLVKLLLLPSQLQRACSSPSARRLRGCRAKASSRWEPSSLSQTSARFRLRFLGPAQPS